MHPEQDDSKNAYYFVALGLGAFAFLLGILGLFFEDNRLSPPDFYAAVQLLLLNADAAKDNSSDLVKVAQVVMGFSWLVAGFGTAELVWRRTMHAIARMKGGHTVVIGGGQTGRAVLSECTSEVVESVEGLAQNWKALVRARHIVACSDDDSANVAVVAQAMKANREHNGRAEMFAHIANPRLRAVLRKDRAFRSQDGQPRVTIFNRPDYVARALFQEHPLDWESIGPGDPRRVHLVVVGFDAIGEAIAVRAALLAHFANQERPIVSVIDPHATVKGAAFLARFPAWFNVVDGVFLDGDPTHPQIQQQIASWVDPERGAMGTVVIAVPEDAAALHIAFDLVRLSGGFVPIRVVPAGGSGIALLEGGESWPSSITIFGEAKARLKGRSWKDDQLDDAARKMHQNYVAGLSEDEKRRPNNRSVLSWELLDDDLVESNRHFADHIPVKRRAVQGRTSLDARDVDLLAQMEHRRWMAERLLGGWRYGPVKDVDARISPDLKDWGDLTFNEQEKDRRAVRSIFEPTG